MRSVNNKVNFSEETGITDEAISAYVDGALSPAQKELLEKLLVNDPFAQEALEGWLQVSDKVAAHLALKQTEAKIMEKTGYEESPVISINYRKWLMAAASVALFIGVGYGVIQLVGNMSKTENIAEAESVQPIIIPESTAAQVVTDSISIATNSLDSSSLNYNVNDQTTNTSSLNTESVVSSLQNEKEKSEPFSSPEDLKILAEGSKAKDGRSLTGKKESAENLFTTAGEKANSNIEANMAKPVAAAPAVSRTDIIASDMDALTKVSARDAARLKFDSKNYREAAQDYKSILQSSPDDAEALYFGGISEYFTGDISNAEQKFDKLLKGKRGYSDGSVWYKANILLRKGQRKEAVKMLKNLSEGNGNFKERATNKLGEIGE